MQQRSALSVKLHAQLVGAFDGAEVDAEIRANARFAGGQAKGREFVSPTAQLTSVPVRYPLLRWQTR
jgi:hypothetical protein